MSPNSDIIGFLESVIYGKRRDPVALIVRLLLAFISIAYSTSLWLYHLPFKLGLHKKHRLSRPVLSVGNITVGGTGKTPVVRYICKLLLRHGVNPAVLSYGYGGSLGGNLGIVSNRTGVLLSPEAAGDEPVMLANSLSGVPVVVCKHRHISGSKAIHDFDPDVLILDDGFQVWKLHRDFDIVLVSSDSRFDNGRVLPSGRLREPLSALKRANCVLITGEHLQESEISGLIEKIREYSPDARIYLASFVSDRVISLDGGSSSDVSLLNGMRVFAFSAIANPDLFENTLKNAGAMIIGSKRFPDHHTYSKNELLDICRSAKDGGATAIVTTEKDAVKLKEVSFDLPIYVVSRKVVLDNEEGFWELLQENLKGAGGLI